MKIRILIPTIAIVLALSLQTAEAQPCTSTQSALPLWQPPAGATHGVQEFDHSVRIQLPPDVAFITVELWGGGGGGGRGSYDTYSEAGAGGGGGAAGSYVRTKFVVTPGRTYALVVGTAGAGASVSGGPSAKKGQDGSDTAVCVEDRILIIAAGGPGGDSAPNNGRSGLGGKGHTLAYSVTVAQTDVQRRGSDGHPGMLPLLDMAGYGGKGGASISGTVQPKGNFGGAGGIGEMRPDRAGDGKPGGSGGILISW